MRYSSNKDYNNLRQMDWKKVRKNGCRKFAAICMMVLLVCNLSGCLEDYEEEDTTDGTGRPGSEDASGNASGRSSISMELGEDGALQITRPSREVTTPMGEDGTWTIFVYMCGTDLESESGLATMDIQEMVSASTGDQVQFVVQTGGTNGWEDGQIDSDSFERYCISDGEMVLEDQQSLGNMGDSASLADFLRWGIADHPAAHMGLIFWNHGGGSISGVCFDERNDSDSLSLREIDAALLSVYDSMTDNFEFVGFDACLMGTIECANILASYADYMYGSEELEPGYGWDYKSIGDYLGENPTADGADLGTVVADSFYEACDEIGEGSTATFSISDLSQVDALLTDFHAYAANLYAASEEDGIFTDIVRNAVAADNYGGNNKAEGYTNMVDLAGVVNAGADYAAGADTVLEAIRNVVIYSRNGSDHEDACGLATYYPLQIQGSTELSTFGEIAVSPYYLSFVDRVAYGAANAGDVSSYDNEEITGFWGLFDYLLNDDTGDYYDAESDSDYWDYYDSYEQTGESALITFDQAPAIDEDGTYGFVLTQDALTNTAGVQASVYMLSEDGNDLIELGLSTYLNMDWTTGAFSDNFDGSWFSLPDGQNLEVYIVTEGEGYDVYTSPVLLNGVATNLRITHDYENGVVTIDGTWAGVDENGMAAKEIVKLQPGDEIIPTYYATAVDSEEEYEYQGNPYQFQEGDAISFEALTDGDYYYGFMINDAYGDYYITDYVGFNVEGDEVYYYTE